MGRGIRRQAPALVVACAALIAALGGSVYAAQKIDGRTVRARSLPGNRVTPGSLPGNRLRPGTIGAAQLAPGAVNAAQIDVAELGQVPSAAHADSATSARDAQTALNAVNALDATRVNGYGAGCRAPTRLFAGACWQTQRGEAPLPAPEAAVACANEGGELPGALELAAFAQQPEIKLAEGGEWTDEVAVFSGTDVYSVITISPEGKVTSAASTATRKYRCVLPLVH